MPTTEIDIFAPPHVVREIVNDFVDLGPRLLADEGSGGAEMLDFDELGTWHKGFLKSIKSISPEGKIGIDLDVGDQLIADQLLREAFCPGEQRRDD